MPPLLLIHGAFSHAGHFGGWARFFAQAGFDCHVASLPGHAPSDPGALAALTMADYLAALQRACAQLTAPPILIGHSMGGLLAQQLAATGPCAALGCVASAPPWMLPAHPRALPFLLPLMPTILRGRTLHPTETILRALALNRLPGHEQAELIPTFVAESGKAYRAMILGAARLPGNHSLPPSCASAVAATASFRTGRQLLSLGSMARSIWCLRAAATGCSRRRSSRRSPAPCCAGSAITGWPARPEPRENTALATTCGSRLPR